MVEYPVSVEYMLKKQKELVPDQAKYGWSMVGWNKESVENTMTSALQGVYMGLANAQLDLDLQQRKLDLAQKTNNADKVKYGVGMATENDMEQSNYNLLAAQSGLKAAQRTLENMTRSMDSLLGLDINSPVGTLDLKDTSKDVKLESVDYYINSAEQNRMELLDLQNQIDIKKHEISVIGDYLKYKSIDIEIPGDYKAANNDLNSLTIQLSKKKLEIQNEIKSAYVDVLKTGNDLKNLKNTLDTQENNLTKIKAQYDAGLVSPNMLEQMEIGVGQVENGYTVACLNYSNKFAKLQAASEIGPSY